MTVHVRNSKMFQIIFLFFICLSLTNADFIVNEECLNYTVYPVQYDLTIMPYVYWEHPYYTCDIAITVIARAPYVNVIELDARELEIRDDTIRVFDGSRDIVNGPRPFQYDNVNGKLFIYLKEPLKVYDVSHPQFYVIRMSFVKYLKEDGEGVFLVKYGNNNKNIVYATRLSPNKAKYFFPCFDNPRFEAVFKFRVYILAPHSMVQYTNTTLVIAEVLKRQITDNNTIIEYLPSPQVGLHQVGFHCSQFSNIQSKSRYSNDTLIVWARGNVLNYYYYVLNFGQTIIDLIHQYSTIRRPLLKGPINIVSLPIIIDGFEIGSWSLLTNGITHLEDIPHVTSAKQRERMMFEITQQLCRIWLGNPGEVAQTRWSEEWFKEGVATYLAYYFLAQYHQGETITNVKRPLSLYGLQMKHKAMEVDWHHSTPALETFNTSLAIEIPPRYQMLVTMKTGALLWMLENSLESTKFHYAFVKYINSRRGKYISLKDFMNTLDIDTVECLNQFFNGSTASRILKSWFHQPGYPVINVQVLRDRSPDAIQLKQRKFSFHQHNRKETDFLIPISYLVQNNQNCYNCHKPRFTIGKQPYTFRENLNNGWIILDATASGYFRVNYDETTWRLIAKALKTNYLAINELNRAQIVNDVLALYVAGDLDMDLALEILDYLDQERSRVVWDSVKSGFDLLRVDGAECKMTKEIYKEWEQFMKKKLSKIFTEVIDEEESGENQKLFKTDIVEFACELHYEPCLLYARSRYEQHVLGERWLDPDTRSACFYVIENDSKENRFAYMSNLNEIEDRMAAEKRVRSRKMFTIKIPVGQPRPMKLVSTTELTPINPVPVVPEKLKQMPDGSAVNIASMYTLCITSLIYLFA